MKDKKFYSDSRSVTNGQSPKRRASLSKGTLHKTSQTHIVRTHSSKSNGSLLRARSKAANSPFEDAFVDWLLQDVIAAEVSLDADSRSTRTIARKCGFAPRQSPAGCEGRQLSRLRDRWFEYQAVVYASPSPLLSKREVRKS